MTSTGTGYHLDPALLIEQLQNKMHKLAAEFASGEINREQFHSIYEHYQTQINLASRMLDDADQLTRNAVMPGLQAGHTIMLRKQLTGMAKSMAVYYYATAQFLELLGDFDVPLKAIARRLGELAYRAENGEQCEPELVPSGSDYLLFVPGKYTATIMVFSHEPIVRQVGTVRHMHNDFETANEAALRSGRADASRLVYPFLAFVRRNLQKH